MNKLMYALFLATILACSEQHVVENTMADTITTPPINKPSDNIADTTYIIQRDSLILAWYNHLLIIADADLNYRSEKKPQLNKYVTGQIDTIEHLTFDKSTLLVYRTIAKNILVGSDILNPEISLSKNIKIGIPKKELFNALNVQSSSDTITVTDFEGNSNFILIFENNLLSRIIYSGYID